jgi:TctA family transporter
MTIMGIGIYSLNNSAADVFIMAGVGFFGMIFVKCQCSFPPMILGIVLGPLMEESLRRALLISRGDPTVFVTRPISCGFMIVTAILMVVFLVPVFRKKREQLLEVAGDEEAK